MAEKKTDELPSTLQRSDADAQKTYAATLESAEEQYGDGSRAHRTAWSAVKHSHEKVGDHWEPKDENGPSDEQSERGGAGTALPSSGGVDANASKEHLLSLARRLDVPGRSTMTKPELVDALERANDHATARARQD